MIRRFFAITLFLLSVTGIKSATGDWYTHISYSDATYCQVAGNKIYVLASGALFSYDKEDGTIYTYDKQNELSDYEIVKIVYCKSIDALLIVYKNANIDLLYSNDYVYNISDFKNKVMTSKSINNADVSAGKAYISTNFGVVVLDLEKTEFTHTYNLNLNTNCAFEHDGNLYIGTSDGIYKGALSDNLLDRANWNKINDQEVVAISETAGRLLCAIDNKGIYTMDENGANIVETVANKKSFKFLYKQNGKIYSGWEDKLYIISDEGDCSAYAVTDNTNYLSVDGSGFWNCKGTKGLVENRITDGVLTDGENYIQPDSPVRSYCEFMNFSSNDKLLVAGGTLNYLDKTFYPGTLYEYDYNDKKWINYPEEGIVAATGVKYVNVCSIDEDPNEPGHCFAGSFGQGLYEFRNGELTAHYNHKNSPLESPLPSTSSSIKNYIRVPKVEYDNNGNLWIINTHVDDIIKILKSDGTWQSLHYDKIAGFETVTDMFVDTRGWLWVVSMCSEPGLFCAKTNNTLFDTSDDQTKVWTNGFVNQDGTSYTVYYIYCAVEDKNGKIWVGTDNGLFVIDDAGQFYNDGIYTQIKVPRNDGSGLADYLLNGAVVTALQVDGANRKWIGTKNDGIYLISEDGLEMIQHFTTDNSPLPSNHVVSIAIHEKTGEVFIGTNGGIVSYMSDATEPESTLSESVVYAYPNPVRASYNGNIHIAGLTHDCEVKIVDTAGYLIAEGHSNGGLFLWNGRNNKGERVSSGVYYVLLYDANGDESVATKILVTK